MVALRFLINQNCCGLSYDARPTQTIPISESFLSFKFAMNMYAHTIMFVNLMLLIKLVGSL